MRVLCVFLSLLLLVPLCARAGILDDTISKLTQRRDELKQALSQCESQTKKFKIAGISTLAATGIGVAANVKLYDSIKNIGNDSANFAGAGAAADIRSEAQKSSDECEMFCGDDIDFATSMGCEC